MEPALCRPSYVLFILVLLPIAFLRSNAEVVTLTADTFTDKFGWPACYDLVKFDFYVDITMFLDLKSRHPLPNRRVFISNKLGTLWEDLGKAVEAEDEIEVGEVDCSLNKAVCTKVDIHSYPTFKIFYDGEEFAKYQGQRDVEALKSFVLKEADKAAKTNLEDDKDEL